MDTTLEHRAGSGTLAPPRKPGDGYVQSFARGLSVLRTFGATRPAQTMAEVAEAAGLTRAGARRILLTLHELGYVEVEGRQFRLAPKVLELGFAYVSSLPFWDLAEPVMEELAQEVKESVSAAVLDGEDIVYVLRIPVHKILAINIGIGSRLPAYCTSMGRVLLAGKSDEVLKDWLHNAHLTARTPKTETDPDRLLEIIRQVRQQGWSIVTEELEMGLVSMAAPIFDRAGRVIAAVNISGQTHRTPPAYMLDKLLPRLIAAGQQISALVKSRQ